MLSTPAVRRIERSVLAVGMLLRLYLALVNGEANDDHLAVIRIIAQQHRLPGLREAWEGFQPKLYHVSVAILWHLSPWQSHAAQVRIAQLVACVAGIATLFVLYRALARWDFKPPIRALVLAFVAFNPTLIGLNAQATNDSFVILFATVALTEGCEFFRTGARRALVVGSVSVVLAVLSKGNGLVVFAAITSTFVVAILRGSAVPSLSPRQLAGRGVGLATAVVVLAAALGPYRSNWKDTGDPFAINGDRAPMPHLFERTYVYRPGVTSIADGFFTFRLGDMLAHPANTNDLAVYPLHRTSLWSQLYGRAHFVHFAQHPPSWRNTDALTLTVGRAILLLALLPTGLMLVGLLRATAALLPLRRPRAASAAPTLDQALLALAAWGFLAFIVIYSFAYRDFSTMKAEFLFPALPAWAFCFGAEVQRAAAGDWAPPWLRALARWALAALLALYLTDITILAAQLT